MAAADIINAKDRNEDNHQRGTQGVREGQSGSESEAKWDVWQEDLDGIREIKAGGGNRKQADPKSHVVQVRLKSGLSQGQFAAALGVSKRTLEQREQDRRKPSGTAKHC